MHDVVAFLHRLQSSTRSNPPLLPGATPPPPTLFTGLLPHFLSYLPLSLSGKSSVNNLGSLYHSNSNSHIERYLPLVAAIITHPTVDPNPLLSAIVTAISPTTSSAPVTSSLSFSSSPFSITQSQSSVEINAAAALSLLEIARLVLLHHRRQHVFVSLSQLLLLLAQLHHDVIVRQQVIIIFYFLPLFFFFFLMCVFLGSAVL